MVIFLYMSSRFCRLLSGNLGCRPSVVPQPHHFALTHSRQIYSLSHGSGMKGNFDPVACSQIPVSDAKTPSLHLRPAPATCSVFCRFGEDAKALSVRCHQYPHHLLPDHPLEGARAFSAGIHGTPASVSRQAGRRGGLVLWGSQLPAPHQRPRDPVWTIVLPDGIRGTEFLQKHLRPKPAWWEPEIP